VKRLDSFRTKKEAKLAGSTFWLHSLQRLETAAGGSLSHLPISLKILLENLLRQEDGRVVKADDIQALIAWEPKAPPRKEIAFMPARVLLQDFTGVPCVVDLAAMRDAVVRMGGEAPSINPLQRVDLVIDHSVQVDVFGTREAFATNTAIEFDRNRERYAFLRWGQQAFENFRVVPPGTGIVHQINLEYLADVVYTATDDGQRFAYPDTLVGTDSHTTMINGLGVLGWGVGGIEAEAAMLGQSISMLIPHVVGFKLTGKLQPGATATDVVLTVTNILRKKGVVGKFVEFFGPGLGTLTLADRATIANMSPEYGATMGFFPVDNVSLEYLRFSGRSPQQVALVEAYCKEQGLFHSVESPEPNFSDLVALDLSGVEPSIAGPKRPQDLVPLSRSKAVFIDSLGDFLHAPAKKKEAVAVDAGGDSLQSERLSKTASVRNGSLEYELRHGSVVIAAITSCTNTSNPSVMIGAGLLAKKAVERGLRTKPWVKTSLAPGSKVVTNYLQAAGLIEPLEKLGFHLVGYGCTTCIGNSGPLAEPIAKAIQENDLVAVSVLSGNRNFEGRINPHTRANYLASPPLVVAYALAGAMDIDIQRDPIGDDLHGKPVYLKDIWPTQEEVQNVIGRSVKSEMFRKEYADVFKGDERWQNMPVPAGARYAWDEISTYIKPAPFFIDMPKSPNPPKDVRGARVLALLGDSVTTDHISPAGSIPTKSPAGQYLVAKGVDPKDFNSYGARRGNHEVMMRGTFANIRLRNLLAPGTEGGWTVHPSSAEPMTIFEASMKYQKEGVPLVVIAGKEYGSGSSRDWAAKGPRLLGVRAVIAESFERIHRSNLIGMGVLPLQFMDGENWKTLGLTGYEVLDIEGISSGLRPGKSLQVTAHGSQTKTFQVVARIDTPNEVDYYTHDGILQYVLRGLVKA
jgi:aconitate hydratase